MLLSLRTHVVLAPHRSLPYLLSCAEPLVLGLEAGIAYVHAGYEVSQWVFLTDESSSSANAQGWGILAVRLHAAREALDFPAGTDVGCIISIQ